MSNEINLYDAIKEMRILSSLNKTFSFSHVSFNRNSLKSNGIRNVENAILRPQAKSDDVEFADYKLFYFDNTIKQPRVCWQMLIIYFNNKKVILNG